MSQALLDARSVVLDPSRYQAELWLRQFAWTVLMNARGHRVNRARLDAQRRAVAA